MLDIFIERWLGFTLVLLGLGALAASLVLFLGWVMPPLPPPSPGVTTYVLLRPLRYRPDIYASGGILLVSLGWGLRRHFREEQEGARLSNRDDG